MGNINTQQEAVVNTDRFDLSQEVFSKGKIELISYAPNELIYTSNNNSNGLAVFSEIYYPKGWKAYIDGKESDILQVNYVLRGLEIPSGNHEIRFEFKPDAYFIGNKVMLGSSIMIFILLIGGLAFQIRKSL